MDDKFNISVNVERITPQENASSRSTGPGCGMLMFLAVLFCVFGGIGNSVFSGNSLTYAPVTTTSTAGSPVGMIAVMIFILVVLAMAAAVIFAVKGWPRD